MVRPSVGVQMIGFIRLLLHFAGSVSTNFTAR